MEVFIEFLKYFGITPENAGKYFMFAFLFVALLYILLKKELKPIKNSTNEIKKCVTHFDTYLVRLSTYFESKYPKSFSPIYKELEKRSSPTTLTELGDKILRDSKIDKYINENIESLFNKIDKSNPKTAFDVENDSFNALIGDVDDDSFIEIKNWLYENPEYEDSKNEKFVVDLTMVLRVGRLYLRDKYLEKHPELTKTSRSSGNK